MAARVEICAPMGVGKTTLAAALAAHGFHPAHERAEMNPHLADFYAGFSPATAYKKDMWFVFHLRAILRALPRDKPAVLDFSQPICRAYVDAGINTAANARKLQSQFDAVARAYGPPDLLIVLDLSLAEQQARIRRRARAGEDDVPEEYLRDLAAATAARVAEAEKAGVNILRIDARRDFRDPAVVAAIASEIKALLPVERFAGAERFLSNFWPARVAYNGLVFESVENAYQAAKCRTAVEMQPFCAMTPAEAKRHGETVALRPDWNDVKVGIMRDLLRQKFARPDLRRQLLATGRRTLIEGNTWNDRFWGVCDGSGENNLGKLLMELRRAAAFTPAGPANKKA